MKYEVIENGNLRLVMEEEDREAIAEMVEQYPDDRQFLYELLQFTGWEPNGELFHILPEEIWAMTDAPIIGNMNAEDLTDFRHDGKCWVYPQYAIMHFGQYLLDHGNVVFMKV